MFIRYLLLGCFLQEKPYFDIIEAFLFSSTISRSVYRYSNELFMFPDCTRKVFNCIYTVIIAKPDSTMKSKSAYFRTVIYDWFTISEPTRWCIVHLIIYLPMIYSINFILTSSEKQAFIILLWRFYQLICFICFNWSLKSSNLDVINQLKVMKNSNAFIYLQLYKFSLTFTWVCILIVC
jgi:hypothetical protein